MDKQQQLLDLEKQKVAAAALLMNQSQTQLLQQKQALQQLLQKQQAQLKKEALETVTSITAAPSEPDIQITGVTRQAKSNVISQPLNLSNQLTRTITSSSNNLLANRFTVNKPINSLANGTVAATPFTSGSPSTSMVKLQDTKMKGKTPVKLKTKKEVSAYGDNSDDEDEEMEVAGVNLQVFCLTSCVTSVNINNMYCKYLPSI